jgi:STE24 endopeptidase
MTVQFNTLMFAFLAVFFAGALARMVLTALNIRHLRRYGHDVPPVFSGEIDEATLVRISDYTIENSRFSSWEGVFDDLVTLAVLLGGVLPCFVGVILALKLHFVFSGLIFFGGLAIASALLGLPFELYRTFGIEKKYGFSTITVRLWIMDLLKSMILSAVLLGILLGVFLSLMFFVEKTWWFWAWLVFASFQLLMLWLYPVVIAPLFNKFEPVQDVALNDAIVVMMAKAGLKTEGVFQVDEGKRSRHTNAYFTGFGKTKRICLYDTLLKSNSCEEILAILAHEIGHWKKRHILKQLVFIEAASLITFYLIYRLLGWAPLYRTFGFMQDIPYAGLLLAGVILAPVFFFLTPLGTAVQRKFEREADDFGVSLTGGAQPLCNALKRLAKDNLANLHPHPFYAGFYYSHPPLTERIRRLQGLERQITP